MRTILATGAAWPHQPPNLPVVKVGVVPNIIRHLKEHKRSTTTHMLAAGVSRNLDKLRRELYNLGQLGLVIKSSQPHATYYSLKGQDMNTNELIERLRTVSGNGELVEITEAEQRQSADELDRLRTEAVAADIRIANDALVIAGLTAERDALKAELAALEKQEPVMIYEGRCVIDCGDSGHQDVTMLKMIPEGAHLYAAAGAIRSIPQGVRRKLLDELGAEWEGADGNEWDDAVVTMVENYLAAGAAPVPNGHRLVSVEALTKWRNAFAEELSAWDIDPPLHHVQTSHDELSAILAAAPVTEGWRLVPVEPTPDMCAEGLEDEGCTVKDGKRFARAIYSAMLAAAPKEQS